MMMQAINRDKNDLDAKWDKAVLHSEIDEPRKASRHILLVFIMYFASAMQQ